MLVFTRNIVFLRKVRFAFEKTDARYRPKRNNAKTAYLFFFYKYDFTVRTGCQLLRFYCNIMLSVAQKTGSL